MSQKIIVKQFKGSFLPFQGAEVKSYFEILKESFQPDIVFTHYREDRHQDHRSAFRLSLEYFRDHLILEYEIPKYDGDLGSPNLFVTLSKSLAKKRLRILPILPDPDE